VVEGRRGFGKVGLTPPLLPLLFPSAPLLEGFISGTIGSATITGGSAIKSTSTSADVPSCFAPPYALQ